MRSTLAIAALLSACGRINFAPIGDAGAVSGYSAAAPHFNCP